MSLKVYNFEAGSNGITITAANSGGATPVVDAGGSATFVNTTPYQGALCGRYQYPASGSTGVFQAYTPNSTDTQLSWTFTFRLNSVLTNTTTSIASYRSSGGSLYSIRAVISGSAATLRLFIGSTDSGTFATITMGDGNWYRVAGVTNGSTGTYAVKLYNAQDTQIGTLSGTNAGIVGTVANVRVGQNSVLAQAVSTDIDYVGFDDGSTTEIPPYDPGDTPTIAIEQPAANIVDLRNSIIVDDTDVLTFPNPVHISGPTLTFSSLVPGLWLFSQSLVNDSVYEFTVKQDNLEEDSDTAEIAMRPHETVNIAAPRRPTGTPPASTWE